MKKDHIRDYATEAFRYYARLGKPTYEQLKKQIYDEAIKQSKQELVRVKMISKPTEAAIINAENTLAQRQAELLDVLAVENTLQVLERGDNGKQIKRAVEIVYFTLPYSALQKNDISDRIHKASIELPAGTASIYRWLKKARVLFAIERGLRI